MAGRGRGATLPAWMTSGAQLGSVATQQDAPTTAPQLSSNIQPITTSNQTNDSAPKVDHTPRNGESKPGRSRDRNDDRRRSSRERQRSRDRERSRDRDRSRDRRRYHSPSPPEWIPRAKRGLRSNFDVPPPNGIDLPPIGVNTLVNGVPNSYYSFFPTSISNTTDKNSNSSSCYGNPSIGDTATHTRHARRIYVGGIPYGITEFEINDFFSQVIFSILSPTPTQSHIYKINVNNEKNYCFLELNSIEVATLLMNLDGIHFNYRGTVYILRIKRPSDFRPSILSDPNVLSNTEFKKYTLIPDACAVYGLTNLNYITSTQPGNSEQNPNVVSEENLPGKLFIGGIPYHLNDDHMIELLSAFGPIRNFHIVKDTSSTQQTAANLYKHKGYGFCEYLNKESAENAIKGLNGMALGDKTMSVRYANQPATSTSTPQDLLSLNCYKTQIPSRVLKLFNMITINEVNNPADYQDILEDVTIECNKYGKVLEVHIPKDIPPSFTHGFIFVFYETLEDSLNGAKALHGRKFGDNIVIVHYHNENDYKNRVLF